MLCAATYPGYAMPRPSSTTFLATELARRRRCWLVGTPSANELNTHHSAEDDDLWPILRPALSDPTDLAAVDAMVDEHRHIPSALADVDAAIHGDAELTPLVEQLSALVLDHLAHEERVVLPLIEQHLTQAQWHAFLMKERSRRPVRERPEFLTWVLDEASQDDVQAVLSEIPAPGQLVYRRILRPRYEAQHRWLVSNPASAPRPKDARRS